MIFQNRDFYAPMTAAEIAEDYAEAERTLTPILMGGGGNWDIFGEEHDGGRWTLWAIARPNSGGAKSSYFGDVEHLAGLIVKGYERAENLTEAGRAILSRCLDLSRIA